MINPITYFLFNFLKIIGLCFLFILTGCGSSRLGKFEKTLNEGSLQNSFHGMVVFDTETQKTIYNSRGDSYFTPASNVKIFTLFTGISRLPQRMPALQYLEKGDTVFIKGTGDPSFLHPVLMDSTALHFLSSHKEIKVYLQNSKEDRYGPGWAWEDFDTYFSPEKGPLPLYGNVLTVSKGDSLQVYPEVFKDSVRLLPNGVRRSEFKNEFYLNPKRKDTISIPYRTSEGLTQKLLSDVLQKEVVSIREYPEGDWKTLYGIETDTIYKLMMLDSDNFLAEQLLMTVSSTTSDTLSTSKSIRYMLDNDLKDLKQPPRWVDGSGLSRYNLFTPESMVQVLQKLYRELPEERLFTLFPLWDASGTIEEWSYPNTSPFIYAKSGSLGNNYNLSGYVKTKSGKILIFSSMNNHFRVPSSEVRSKIFEILLQLYHRH
ncbi:D-alanyl-D-alanine carboxypeptidase [Flagellimonas allohymeniacidonis]|uniref:D-alanyl-D-alanine carboxypeptidase n=2 Tax=Flagellimonas allohymeniacidonis TaxID=2517819 RepID=A0A4Q8QMJ5_9FLAO|nr:D-alanyl-D-alanine carboxypeptidase [Allomuricauda hymeniacidonis]